MSQQAGSSHGLTLRSLPFELLFRIMSLLYRANSHTASDHDGIWVDLQDNFQHDYFRCSHQGRKSTWAARSRARLPQLRLRRFTAFFASKRKSKRLALRTANPKALMLIRHSAIRFDWKRRTRETALMPH